MILSITDKIARCYPENHGVFLLEIGWNHHVANGKGIYIYLAICDPRYDFKKCKKMLPKNLWVLVLVLMKKENEGIALDANVHLFIVHLFTWSNLSKWSGWSSRKKSIELYKIAENIFRFILNWFSKRNRYICTTWMRHK